MSTANLPLPLWCANAAAPPAGGWVEVHDRVMGGRSTGTAVWVAAGEHGVAHLHLSGWVSRDHGGGFASFRLQRLPPHRLGAARAVQLQVQGDGGVFKCCLHRSAAWDGVQWQTECFATLGWTTLTQPLAAFTARHRGHPVQAPAWRADDAVAQIGILVSREQAGPFDLRLVAVSLV